MVASAIRPMIRNVRSPAVRGRPDGRRIWSVAYTDAGAIYGTDRPATSLEILIWYRPEQRGVLRQIAPSAHVEVPRSVLGIGCLDPLFVLQGLPQVAAANLGEITRRVAESGNLRHAVRPARYGSGRIECDNGRESAVCSARLVDERRRPRILALPAQSLGPQHVHLAKHHERRLSLS